ncbi:MAG: response regulator [Candidatus Thiodiazotropha sp.]
MAEADTVVYLVDDDAAVRGGLRLLLEQHELKVHDFASADEFLEYYRADFPGCLVLDLRMPGTDGLALQTHLATQRLPIPVIFISGHGSIPVSVKAIKSGAVNFLEKPVPHQELLRNIREALLLDARHRSQIEKGSEFQARYASLTPREREIMAMVVSGLTNKEMAEHLHISFRTVEIHRSRMMKKLQTGNLVDLLYAARICDVAYHPTSIQHYE